MKVKIEQSTEIVSSLNTTIPLITTKVLNESDPRPIADHIASRDNPHEVTASQVGADPVGSADAVQTNLDTHTSDTANPHAVTASQVGAYTSGEVDTLVNNTVEGLLNSAPENLDTLKELADALGNDENFSETVLNSLTEKALDSDLQSHIGDTDNPHSVTTSQIGAVDLTTDQTIGGVKSFSNNVGIGTDTPSYKLDVETTTDEIGRFVTSNQFARMTVQTTESGGFSQMNFGTDNAFNSAFFINYASGGAVPNTFAIKNNYGDIALFTGTGGSSNQKVTIDSDGNVGIGTTTPSEKLDVNGNVNVTGTINEKDTAFIPIAAGSINASAGTAYKIKGATVSKTGTGTFTITFDQPQSDSNYTVLLTMVEISTTFNQKGYVNNKTTTSFDVRVAADDNGGTPDVPTDRNFDFVVLNW